jgi:PAS domain S-box-containing protein
MTPLDSEMELIGMRARSPMRERLWIGLGPRVISLVLLAVLLAGGLIGWLVIQNSRSIIRESVLSRNLAIASVAGDLAAQFVDGAEASLRQLAARPLFIKAVLDGDLEQAEWHMEQVMQIDDRFDNIAVYSADGIGWASGLRAAWQNRGGSVADREWFQSALATKTPYFALPTLSRGTGHAVVPYIIPMLDDQGVLHGMLVGGISLAELSDAITGISAHGSTEPTLLDTRQGGFVVADLDPELILLPMSGRDEVLAQALSGQQGTIETRDSSGEVDLVAFGPVEGLPWSVLVSESAATAFVPVATLTKRALLYLGAILLATLFASAYFARRITTPLYSLAKGAAEVGSGNLDHRFDMVRRDEIGVVSRAFDRMTTELKTTLVSRDELSVEVAERKRAEEALRELAGRQEAILAAVPDILMEVDSSKVYTWANQAGLEFFGDDVLGKEAALYFEGEQSTYDRVAPLFNGRQDLVYVESWQLRKDGETRLLAWLCRTLYNEEGLIRGALSSALDITERRRAEEALRTSEDLLRQSQKMEAVGQLAGGMAHDFNNLLTAIIGYSDLVIANKDRLDETSLADVLEIKHAAERASSLTRQILAFSRRQALQPTVVSLNDVVRGMEPFLQRTLGEDVDLVTRTEPALAMTELDVNQFEQVLMNLALNARDAMPAGGRLTIGTGNVELDRGYCKTHPDVQPGPYVMLSVSDTGVGMDAETKTHIFEPFFTTKPMGEGTGLGLSSVYGIVKQSGGSIGVYSEPGLGTTFKVYLPQASRPAPLAMPSASAPPSSSCEETILVVEDEESLRSLVARILGGLGYTVLLAATATEALEIVQESESPVDLLLTDVVLPGGMQGNDLARSVLRFWPDLPVLYMSGYARDAIVHAGRLDEGVNYLEKPFTPDSLAAKVREVLADDAR